MKTHALDLLLWFLASPILFLRWIFRTVRRIRFWTVAYAPRIPCLNCHAPISLVGIWRCGCGYTYRGHLLRHCSVCGSLPRMVRLLSLRRDGEVAGAMRLTRR